MKFYKVILTLIFCCSLILGEVACGDPLTPTTTLEPTTTTTALPTTTLPTTTLPPAPQEFLLVGTNTWDLDTNTQAGAPIADLWYDQATSRTRNLVPQDGAKIAVIRGKIFDEVTFEDLAAAGVSTDPISVSDKNPAIDVRSVIAVFTNGAAYAKMEVLGFESKRISGHTVKRFSIRFRYVLYR
jgi:hypothetical protein